MLLFHPRCQVVEYMPHESARVLSDPFEMPLMDKQVRWHMENDFSGYTPKEVCLESLFIRKTKLIGLVYCRNLQFEKQVQMRYTLDKWQTFREIALEFEYSYGFYDRFAFQFDLSGDKQELEFCFSYRVGDQVYWDNNQGSNYHAWLEAVDPETLRLPSKQKKRLTFQSRPGTKVFTP
ncbi:putative phosphatase regulatory subunit-domain-containing protein [Gorgonomyces haynaldii]|nr:putative phosphatase regulatory subunit-domain-containing protein [Gorgonomyces haynaldii]